MSARCGLTGSRIGRAFQVGLPGNVSAPARHGHCNTFGVDKPIAILHANCQGRPLAARLLASPEFAGGFMPRVYLNYAREAIPAADLERCGLFLYQHLGPEWGDLSSAALLARLPAGCPSL